MNAIILLDKKLADMAAVFDPHYNVPDMGYYKISKNLFLPPPVVATIANYLSTQETEDPNCPIYQELLKLEN